MRIHLGSLPSTTAKNNNNESGMPTPPVFGTITFIISDLTHKSLYWRPTYYETIYKTVICSKNLY